MDKTTFFCATCRKEMPELKEENKVSSRLSGTKNISYYVCDECVKDLKPTVITSWKELSEVPANDKFFIDVDMENLCGRIRWVEDGLQEEYLNTHTFYKGSVTRLMKYGFNIILIGED